MSLGIKCYPFENENDFHKIFTIRPIIPPMINCVTCPGENAVFSFKVEQAIHMPITDTKCCVQYNQDAVRLQHYSICRTWLHVLFIQRT